MILQVFSLISLIALCVAQELTLPVNICHRNSTNYSTCLKHAIQEAWPRFVQGLPEFNFPVLDPLFYNAKYDIGELHIKVANVTAIGFASAHFLALKTYLVDNIFYVESDLHMPTFYCEGLGQVIGNFGPFKLNNTANVNITVTDSKINWNIMGHVANDKWTVEHFKPIPITIKTVKVHLNMLDNKELNDVVENFINEYWPAIYRTLMPTIIDVWDSWAVDLVNRLFSKISFSKTFP